MDMTVAAEVVRLSEHALEEVARRMVDSLKTTGSVFAPDSFRELSAAEADELADRLSAEYYR